MEVTQNSPIKSDSSSKRSIGHGPAGVAKLRSTLGFAANLKSSAVSPFGSLSFNNKTFDEMKKKMNRLGTWSEMKFDNTAPECRTNHATCTFGETLMLYGGRDAGNTKGFAKHLWLMDPMKD